MSKTELVEREAQAVAATEAASFIQMIERAARDPSVDIDKMERLMQMHERMVARQARATFDAAFAVMQPELPSMPERGKIKNKSGGVQSTYALWEDVNDILKPILSKHGFALGFKIANRDKFSVVTGILSHCAGHREESTFELPLDISGSKNDVQGLGSSTSYGKRYVAGALLNLTSRGEDNDGAGTKTMTGETRNGYTAKIESSATSDALQALWKEIATACHECNDLAAHDELKAAVIAKTKALKQPTKEPMT